MTERSAPRIPSLAFLFDNAFLYNSEQKQMRILIVEDDKKVGAFLQKVLKEEQYAVAVCRDGEEALDLAMVNSYDVIIRGKIEVILRKERKEDGSGLLSIRDTGIGIPEEALPFISDRFFVVDKFRSKESAGSGLGLSIVKEVADIHRAVIDVPSQVNQRTTFRIKFPLAE